MRQFKFRRFRKAVRRIGNLLFSCAGEKSTECDPQCEANPDLRAHTSSLDLTTGNDPAAASTPSESNHSTEPSSSTMGQTSAKAHHRTTKAAKAHYCTTAVNKECVCPEEVPSLSPLSANVVDVDINKQEIESYIDDLLKRVVDHVKTEVIPNEQVADHDEDTSVPPVEVTDKSEVSTSTESDADIDHQEVKDYIHDLLERVMENVRKELTLDERQTAAKSDDNTPAVEVPSKSSTMDDEDIDHQEVEMYIHDLMARANDKVNADITLKETWVDITVDDSSTPLETGSSHIADKSVESKSDLTKDMYTHSQNVEEESLETTSTVAVVDILGNKSCQNSSFVLNECSKSESEQENLSRPSGKDSSQSNNVLRQRSELCVFEVKLVQGLLVLGLTLGSDELKEIGIQKIRMFSPAATQGELRVSDRIMEINGHSVIGKSPSQTQRLLSQVKWREEVRILAMPPQETVVFHFSETTNAGVIVLKLNTSFDKPLGVDVEGGSDTECPYIRISAIKPGSVAERCGMLKVGDELVEIDQHLMVGTTHNEAIDILRHISKPITLTVQRRQSLNLMDRIHSHHSETD